jgi:hypothetical protein
MAASCFHLSEERGKNAAHFVPFGHLGCLEAREMRRDGHPGHLICNLQSINRIDRWPPPRSTTSSDLSTTANCTPRPPQAPPPLTMTPPSCAYNSLRFICPPDVLTCSRFLRARKFDPAKAHKQFAATEAWRRKFDVPNLYATFDPDELESAKRFYPRWTGRRDRVGIFLSIRRRLRLILTPAQ